VTTKIYSYLLSVASVTTLVGSCGLAAMAVDSGRYNVISSSDGAIVSFTKWQEKNIELADWNNPIRNQGAIGSCQSFAFLGVVENQVFQQFGVSLDLSERYQLFTNFMEFSGMGAAPTQLSKFHLNFAKWGALPEEMYPYKFIEDNAAVFQVDSAQGLESQTEPALDQALKGVVDPLEKSKILQEARFFGPLPEGKPSIVLPVKALQVNEARPQRFVAVAGADEEVPCFSEQALNSGTALSPSEFAKHCLAYEEKNFSVHSIYEISHSFKTLKEVCSSADNRAIVSGLVLRQRQEILRSILMSSILKRSSLIAMSVPDTLDGKKSVLWQSAGTTTHAGHAVVALGFLMKKDLLNLKSHFAGLLGSGLFDELAKTLDANYKLPLSPVNEEELQRVRLDSKLGQAILTEQGIVVVRNSWGDIAGKGGYQALTFDYLLEHGMMSVHSAFGPSLNLGQPEGLEFLVTGKAMESAARLVDGFCF